MSVHTLVVEITGANGDSLRPVYECHGATKFAEMVEWHEQNLSVGSVAVLKGYDYNTDEPEVVWTIKR